MLIIRVSTRPMALRVRDEQQLEQDGVAAAGEGDEAVHLEPEIPHLAGPEEEVAPLSTQVGCVNGVDDGWINGATAE